MITKEQALDALDNLEDCAMMEVGISPVGDMKVLAKYIEQMEAIMEVVGEIVEAYKTTHNSKVFDAIDKLETTLKEVK